ncbi:MAG: hypothetical protein LBJ79_02995, partial [Endomicrobium sp.]|nr:hypothetical protein [Endomicrobium sp.]
AKDEYEAAKGADIIVFATEWKQFKFLDWTKLSKIVNAKIIFDMRNIVKVDEVKRNGFTLYKIGK